MVVAHGDPVADVGAAAGRDAPAARADHRRRRRRRGPITAAARAVRVVDAVLRDRRGALAVAVQALEDDAVALRDARIGAGGVQAIL